MTDGDPSNFSDEILSKYFIKDIKNHLSDGVLSCTLNHILVYEKMQERKQDYAIVFENDPFFLKDLNTSLSLLLPELLKLEKGLIVSLENSTLRFPSYWQTKPNKSLYQANCGRMAGAYIIDLQAVKNILENLKSIKCHTVIDHWHNSLINNGIMKMFWAHPAITEQGSHNGQLNSSISTKPQNFIQKVKWKLKKVYRMLFLRLNNDKSIIE